MPVYRGMPSLGRGPRLATQVRKQISRADNFGIVDRRSPRKRKSAGPLLASLRGMARLKSKKSPYEAVSLLRALQPPNGASLMAADARTDRRTSGFVLHKRKEKRAKSNGNPCAEPQPPSRLRGRGSWGSNPSSYTLVFIVLYIFPLLYCFVWY